MKATQLKNKTGLIFGLALLAGMLQACSTTKDSSPEAVPVEQPAGVQSQLPTMASRRIPSGCDPAEAARRHTDLAGERVMITWAWNNASEDMENLKVPAAVLREASPYLAVNFNPQIPNLEFYTVIWINSGHIKALPDGSYGVDLCSATVEKGGW